MLVNHESRRGQSMANYRVAVLKDSKFYVRSILDGNLKSDTQSIIMHVHKTVNKKQFFNSQSVIRFWSEKIAQIFNNFIMFESKTSKNVSFSNLTQLPHLRLAGLCGSVPFTMDSAQF